MLTLSMMMMIMMMMMLVLCTLYAVLTKARKICFQKNKIVQCAEKFAVKEKIEIVFLLLYEFV
jgi:hypothetical protein